MFGAAPLRCVLIEIALRGLAECQFARLGELGGLFGGPLAGQGINTIGEKLPSRSSTLARFPQGEVSGRA